MNRCCQRAAAARLLTWPRDPVSNALPGQILDRRETRGLPGICQKELTILTSHLPVADRLTPGQTRN